MTWRRLGVLVDALPPESGYKTALRDQTPDEVWQQAETAVSVEPDGHGPWSKTELLLASVVDGLDLLFWQQIQMHSTEKLPPPQPLRRPGVRVRKTTSLNAKQRAFLEARRANRER